MSLDKLSDNEFFDAVKSGMHSTVVHVRSYIDFYKAAAQSKAYVVYISISFTHVHMSVYPLHVSISFAHVSISFTHVSISFAHVSISFAHVPASFPGSCRVVPRNLIRLHVCNVHVYISNHGR